MKRHLAVVLHADVAGYSRLSGSDEEGTHALLVESLDLFARIASGHSGKKINEAGDAILVEFQSAIDALDCAIRFQLDMERDGSGMPGDEGLRFRVGINLGEIIHDRNDIYGEGVNLAARIQETADVGGICISASVYEQVRNKIDRHFDDLGYRSLKNISDPVHIYRVRLRGASVGIHNQPMFDMDVPAAPALLTRGSCLCGNVRFEIDQPAIGTGYCHCRICQQFSGAPVVSWAAFPIDSIRYSRNEPRHIESSRIGRRAFCKDCGSSLAFMRTAPERGWYIAVHTTCLDNPGQFAPTWHGGIESQLPWFDIHDDLPRTRSDEQPDLRKAWESVGLPNPEQWRFHGESRSRSTARPVGFAPPGKAHEK